MIQRLSGEEALGLTRAIEKHVPPCANWTKDIHLRTDSRFTLAIAMFKASTWVEGALNELHEDWVARRVIKMIYHFLVEAAFKDETDFFDWDSFSTLKTMIWQTHSLDPDIYKSQWMEWGEKITSDDRWLECFANPLRVMKESKAKALETLRPFANT